MRRRPSRGARGLIAAVVKIGVMVLLISLIWEYIRQAVTGRGIFGAFDPVMSVVATLIGMNAGAALMLMLLQDAALPGWLKAGIALAAVIVGGALCRKLMLWLSGIVLAALGMMMGIFAIGVVLLMGLFGTYGLMCVVLGLFPPFDG